MVERNSEAKDEREKIKEKKMRIGKFREEREV
jgi:hypothetical protein